MVHISQPDLGGFYQLLSGLKRLSFCSGSAASLINYVAMEEKGHILLTLPTQVLIFKRFAGYVLVTYYVCNDGRGIIG